MQSSIIFATYGFTRQYIMTTVPSESTTACTKDYTYSSTHLASELSEFTCMSSLINGREISIPHEAAKCSTENFEFTVSEQVQVNPDNLRAMSVLTFCNSN